MGTQAGAGKAAEAETIAAVRAAFPDLVLAASEFRGQQRLTVPAARLRDVLAYLRDRHGFALLVDITCVDYLNWRDATDRYGLVYVLSQADSARRLIVRTFVNDPEPAVDTVVPLWEGADWLEREVFDMFGVRFLGHPDLRRILLPEAFAAWPLRKDYPLQGRGERHNFPVLTRERS